MKDLFYVRPTKPLNRAINRLAIHVNQLGNLAVAHALFMELAKMAHQFIRELGTTVGGAGHVRLIATILLHHVLYVVGLRSGKEMDGVYAGRIITAMANLDVVCYRAIVKLVGKAVRAGCRSYAIAHLRETTVALAIFIACPEPTLIARSRSRVPPKLLLECQTACVVVKVKMGLASFVALAGCAGKCGFLAAPAMAISVGNVVRGMIAHTISSFLASCRSRGCSRIALLFLLVFSCNYTPGGQYV